MNLEELRIILDHRPSGMASSVTLQILRIISWILAIFCFGISFSFFVEALFHINLIPDYLLAKPEATDIENLSRTRLSYLLAFVFLLLSIVLIISTYFYNLVIKRNRFIDTIENWCETYRGNSY